MADTPTVDQFLDPLNPADISKKLQHFLDDASNAHVLVDKDELVHFFDTVAAALKQQGTCNELDICINCVELDFLSKALQVYGMAFDDMMSLTHGINNLSLLKKVLTDELDKIVPAKIEASSISNVLHAMLRSFAITEFEHSQTVEITGVILLMACTTFRTKLIDGFARPQA